LKTAVPVTTWNELALNQAWPGGNGPGQRLENAVESPIVAFPDYPFEVILMNTYLEHFHEGYFREGMPLCLKNSGGGVWLRKN
jgi:hypothetical protein